MTDIATSSLTVRRLVPPETLDAPDAGPFLQMVEIANAACRRDAGHGDLDEDPLEALVAWHDQADWGRTGFLAERDGEIIGVANLVYPQGGRRDDRGVRRLGRSGSLGRRRRRGTARSRRGRGAHARAHRRSRSSRCTAPGAAGPMLAPSTGWGAIPADDRQTVFCVENGLTLEQVERNSAFDLRGSFDAVERMLAEALEKAGPDYRPVAWTSPTPEAYQEGLAYVISRMSTDAPAGRPRRRRGDVGCRAHPAAGRPAAGAGLHRLGRVRRARPDGPHRRLQRARHRGRPRGGDAPVGHPRAEGAPRAGASGRS